MCLILIAINTHTTYKLVVAANRDEYYERPTSPARFWKENSGILSGRDLAAEGTWLGITLRGRIAALTNYRDPDSVKKGAPSRGMLVSDFLTGDDDPEEYLERLTRHQGKYNGFNLIAGEKGRYFWYSNRGGTPCELPNGIYGLSNHLLNTPWPKIVHGKNNFSSIILNESSLSQATLFDMLSDRTIADDKDLPNTGVGLEWERTLSSVFIESPTYGTRSSTLVLIDYEDNVTFIERTFNGSPDQYSLKHFKFRIE